MNEPGSRGECGKGSGEGEDGGEGKAREEEKLSPLMTSRPPSVMSDKSPVKRGAFHKSSKSSVSKSLGWFQSFSAGWIVVDREFNGRKDGLEFKLTSRLFVNSPFWLQEKGFSQKS